MALQCYNKTCGKKFNVEDNNADSCTYHPGAPVFHDALKGWSCCKKRTTDFTEFLNIPGCAKGLHSNVKPPEPEKCDKIEEPTPEIELPKPKEAYVPLPRPSASTPLVPLAATIIPALTSALEKLKIEKTEESSNSVNSTETIAFGTQCQNKGCTARYQTADDLTGICTHHPGCPIFHEGMKYWSCCERKTSDFNSFLQQEGCSNSNHNFTVPKANPNEDPSKACRVDWFQTANLVTITIFAKLSEPARCSILTNGVRLEAKVQFNGGQQIFARNFDLKGIIDPERSNVKFTPSKVEINLQKAELIAWPKLELP